MKILCSLLLLLVAMTGLHVPVFGQKGPTGVIAGKVFDSTNGQPIRQARIAVEGEPAKSAETTLEGDYRINLTPGVYTVTVNAEGYLPTTLEGIVVNANEIADGSTVLGSTTDVTTVTVNETIEATQATAEAALAERRLAPVVSDSISAQEIRNSVASDAAGALEKVTGISIVDSGYVYVRGLGERYSATMLNSAMLPTTEPERRVVPLDLFPAHLIDTIKVLKTYSPDLPGEFSGGLVQLQTIDFPALPTLRVSANFGYNTRTTGKRFGSYRGGGSDFFGFGSGSRSIPNVIPQERLFPGNFNSQEFERFGEAFPADYQLDPIASMRPTQTYSVVAGNTWGRFGLVAALTFSNTPQRYDENQRYLRLGGRNQPIVFTEYNDFTASQESARMGGVLNAAIRLNANNKIIFRNTLTRDTDKEGRAFRGLNGGIDNVIEATRLRFIERGLFATGVEGEHVSPDLGNSVMRWQFTYSRSNRDEPDLRETIRGLTPEGNFLFLPLPQSGLRFFNYLDDAIYEPQAEWGKPFSAGGVSGFLKLGFRGTFRERDFTARRFRFVPVRPATLDFTQPANQLLGPENIRPDGFQIRENTRGTDTYAANMDVYAGFAMVDLALSPRWRMIGGLRLEDADIEVVTVDPLVPGSVPAIANLANRDPLPAVNAIYSITPRQNLRLGYGRTVSRPDFRELSPFDFTNVLGGFNTVGNPNLVRARIDNVDVRWEWFMGGNQLVAASYFYKRFQDPIEVTIQPTTDLRQSFVNAQSAQNQGIELEFRKNLGFLSPGMSPFAIQTNFTFVDSAVTIPPDLALLLTTRERPLLGQSRFIYNVIAEWVRPSWRSNARFYVNSQSRRISDVGTLGLPDIYQEGNMFIDFVYEYSVLESGRWRFKFSAENLADNEYRWTQADFNQRSYRIGRTFEVGTSFSIF